MAGRGHSLATARSLCGLAAVLALRGATPVLALVPPLPLYNGWFSSVEGCNTSSYDTLTATLLGGAFAHFGGDAADCAAWKLAATVCTTPPEAYPPGAPAYNFYCPASGGFGPFCAVTQQYACSDCASPPCAANCRQEGYDYALLGALGPLSLRGCGGEQASQPLTAAAAAGALPLAPPAAAAPLSAPPAPPPLPPQPPQPPVPPPAPPAPPAPPPVLSGMLPGFACAAQDAACAALGDLYAATGGPHWTLSPGWAETAAGEPADYCTFYQVFCEAEAGGGGAAAIFLIGLEGNNLTGYLPASLGALTALRGLSLGNNRLGGTIPAAVGRLTALRQLLLFANALVGSVPASVGSLTSLTRLALDTNALGGTLPAEALCGLTALEALALESNGALAGALPLCVGALRQLTYLGANNNALSGSIPDSLGSLSLLAYLALQSNALSGTLPASLASLTSLQMLLLYDNQLGGRVPAWLGSLAPTLSVLGLSSNLFDPPLPPFLSFYPFGSDFSAAGVPLGPPTVVQAVGPPLTVCPAGQRSAGVDTSASSFFPAARCAPCAAGTVSAAGSAACVPCPAGTFAAGGAGGGGAGAASSSSCAACPDGSTSPALSGWAANCTCLPGYAPAAAAAAAGSGACSPCAQADTYAGPGGCLACPDGSTSPPLTAGLVGCTCADGAPPSAASGECPAPVAVVRGGSGGGLPASTLGAILGGGLAALALATAAAVVRLRRELRRRAAEARWKTVIAAEGDVVLGARIGEGGFGLVFAAEWRGAPVAVKCLWPGVRDGADATLLNESLRCTQSSCSRERCCLDALLARTSLVTFNWPQRVVMGAGVASGVALSALGNDPKVIATGTPAYMAPEVALGSLAQATGSAAGGAALLASRCAVDVYGLGCVVLDLSRPGGRRRRDGGGGGAWRLTPDDPLLARLQSNFAPQIHPSTPPPLAELLRAALAVDPAGRPSAEQARVWLTGMAASSVAWAVAEGQAQAPEGGLGAAVVDG